MTDRPAVPAEPTVSPQVTTVLERVRQMAEGAASGDLSFVGASNGDCQSAADDLRAVCEMADRAEGIPLYTNWKDAQNERLARRSGLSSQKTSSHRDLVIVKLALCECGHWPDEHDKEGICFGSASSCTCVEFRRSHSSTPPSVPQDTTAEPVNRQQIFDAINAALPRYVEHRESVMAELTRDICALSAPASVSPTEAPKPDIDTLKAWRERMRLAAGDAAIHFSQSLGNMQLRAIAQEQEHTYDAIGDFLNTLIDPAAPSPAADLKPAFTRRGCTSDHAKRGLQCNCVDFVTCNHCKQTIHEVEMREHQCPRPAADREAVTALITRCQNWHPDNIAGELLAAYDLTPKGTPGMPR